MINSFSKKKFCAVLSLSYVFVVKFFSFDRLKFRVITIKAREREDSNNKFLINLIFFKANCSFVGDKIDFFCFVFNFIAVKSYS
jgi:hypothetical protein